ncbi:MAG TPA: hypothetical protein VIZ18_11080 [Ktedonobacteraceae bacterium]
MKDDTYIGHKLEQILDEVKAVHELVAAQPTLTDFHRLEGKVDNLGSRMEVAEVAAKDTSADIAELRQQSGYARSGQMAKRRA